MSKKEFHKIVKEHGGYILSDGTCNLKHLLAKAHDFLNEYNGYGLGSKELLDDIWNCYDFINGVGEEEQKCDLFRWQYIGWANLKQDSESLETASYIWGDDLYNLFNEIAPDGFYFGSSEGDGACIGWFEIEEEY